MNEKNNEILEISSDISEMEEKIVLAAGLPETYSTTSAADNTYTGIYKLKNKRGCMYATVNTDNRTTPEVVVDNDKNCPNQWFKVTHLGGGQHSIRPLHKPDLVLTVKRVQSTAYELTAIVCTCDTLATLDAASRWTIDPNGTIRNAQYDCVVMSTCSCATCEFGNIVATICPCDSSQQWELIKLNLTGSIDINVTTDSFLAGKSTKLTAKTPSGTGANWSSSNTHVATVNTAGHVYFRNPGTVEITAYANDLYPKTVTLYCILSDGVYYLYNVGSHKYVQMDGNNLFESHSSLSLNGRNDPPIGEILMWRLHYHGEGKYSIRSYANPRRGIHVSNYEPSVTDAISASDTLNERGGAWYISSDSAGCILTNVSLKDSSLANVLAIPQGVSSDGTKLIYENATGTTSNSYRRWEFRPASSVPTGLYLFKYQYTGSGNSYLTEFKSSTITKDVGDQIDIRAVYRDPDDIPQNFTWSSSDTSVSSVEGGTITAKSTGTTTITVKHSSGASKSITINVRKCAIIVLPGIMGSQIFANEDITISSQGFLDPSNTFKSGERLWDPKADLHADEKILAIKQDSNGNPIYSTMINPPIINEKKDNDFRYGAQDIYREVYNELYDKFYGSMYDIVFFEYDWRKDPYDTALSLDKFITDSNYGKVVFVSHSMGGLVSSYYLSLGENQRNKVAKHISVGTPYLGSADLPDFFTTGAIRDLFYENWLISESVVDIIYNIPSIYALFPCEPYWKEYLSYRSSPSESINCTTYSQTMETLAARLSNWNKNMANRVIGNTKKWFLSNGQHITTLVDSYYIVGTGVKTTYSVHGLPANLINDPIFAGFQSYKDMVGDGTVTKHSATIDDSLDTNKVYYKKASSGKLATHIGMIKGFEKDTVDTSTIEFIIEIINNSALDIEKTKLWSKFGFTRE